MTSIDDLMNEENERDELIVVTDGRSARETLFPTKTIFTFNDKSSKDDPWDFLKIATAQQTSMTDKYGSEVNGYFIEDIWLSKDKAKALYLELKKRLDNEFFTNVKDGLEEAIEHEKDTKGSSLRTKDIDDGE